MLSESNQTRRRFLGTAAMTLAAAPQFRMFGSTDAHGSDARGAGRAAGPGANTSFGPLKQIDAGVLNVGYVDTGRPDGPAVLLLHGCPTTSTPTTM